jgi:hypothetical protein
MWRKMMHAICLQVGIIVPSWHLTVRIGCAEVRSASIATDALPFVQRILFGLKAGDWNIDFSGNCAA